MFKTLKNNWFPRGVRRAALSYQNRILKRVNPDKLKTGLRDLGIAPGDMVCVHSSLSGMGYMTGGCESVIRVLRDLIGKEGTLIMPTFTGGGSTYEYVMSNPPPFNRETTPASTGKLCETFRQLPGVCRSLHPTHSVAVLSPLAREIIKGHENSPTPFGDETPYDYLIKNQGKVLLLNTNANSLLHRIQEVVDWPNLYLDDPFLLEIIDGDVVRTVETAIHHPGPFSHIVLPGISKKEVCFIHFPSYGLPFLFNNRENEIFSRLDTECRGFLAKRYQWFLKEGIVRKGNVGFGEAVMLEAAPFAARVQADIIDHLSRNTGLYERNVLKKMWKDKTASGTIPVL